MEKASQYTHVPRTAPTTPSRANNNDSESASTSRKRQTADDSVIASQDGIQTRSSGPPAFEADGSRPKRQRTLSERAQASVLAKAEKEREKAYPRKKGSASARNRNGNGNGEDKSKPASRKRVSTAKPRSKQVLDGVVLKRVKRKGTCPLLYLFFFFLYLLRYDNTLFFLSFFA
jgi:hypothetical protein